MKLKFLTIYFSNQYKVRMVEDHFCFHSVPDLTNKLFDMIGAEKGWGGGKGGKEKGRGRREEEEREVGRREEEKFRAHKHTLKSSRLENAATVKDLSLNHHDSYT